MRRKAIWLALQSGAGRADVTTIAAAYSLICDPSQSTRLSALCFLLSSHNEGSLRFTNGLSVCFQSTSTTSTHPLRLRKLVLFFLILKMRPSPVRVPGSFILKALSQYHQRLHIYMSDVPQLSGASTFYETCLYWHLYFVNICFLCFTSMFSPLNTLYWFHLWSPTCIHWSQWQSMSLVNTKTWRWQ